MSRPTRPRRAAARGGWTGLAQTWIVLITAASCGSRTPLRDADLCYEAGAVEVCSTTCGDGTQRCVDGRWETCQVPVTRRACANACGAGTATCMADQWSTCEVPVATRSCANECGEGVQSCARGAWSTCEVPVATRTCATLCGTGTETCTNGSWENCDAPRPAARRLTATVRDFQDTHPDFERSAGGSGVEPGIIETVLGPDDKPVYAGKPTTPSTSGKGRFDEWYRDTLGVNMTTTIRIPLTPSPSKPNTLAFSDPAFFPIDGQLFGNQGRGHNYHFTLEVAAKFRYDGGETLRFTGDDDLWVFINRRLAIDLGGLHAPLGGTIDLDKKSAELDLTRGQTYPLHLFFAERHTTASSLYMETNVVEWDACD